MDCHWEPAASAEAGSKVLVRESVGWNQYFHVCFHFCVPLLRSRSAGNNELCWVEGTALKIAGITSPLGIYSLIVCN